jgi:actin related protein 2/3 complex subunit 1A/1B
MLRRKRKVQKKAGGAEKPAKKEKGAKKGKAKGGEDEGKGESKLKHKSTVLTVQWCQNNKFVVTGAADYKCRVVSAFLPGIDSDEDDGFGKIWANQNDFGEVLCEFDQAKAWINAVAWSPNNMRIAFAGHGSTLSVVKLEEGVENFSVQTLRLPDLPLLDMRFLTDDVILAVGFDKIPKLFHNKGSAEAPEFKLAFELDGFVEEKKEEKKAGGGAFAKNMGMFADQASRGVEASNKGKTNTALKRNTIHNNAINCLQLLPQVGGQYTKFTTSGVDGRIVTWDLTKIKGVDLKSIGM